MSIYKRGNVYWFDFMFNGVRFQGSTKQANRRAAGEIEAAKKTQLAKGEVGIEHREPTPSFVAFAERFREEMRSKHQAKPNTVNYYENGLNRLLLYPALRKANLAHVDEQMIAAYIVWRRAQKNSNYKKPDGAATLKVATVNRELEVLRRMLRLALEWKLLGVIPKIRRQPGEEGRDRVVSHAEECTYLAVATQPLRDIATIIIDAGLRPEEVFRMRSENVHLEPAGDARFGYIYNPFGKTKYARRNIPLSQRLKAILEMRQQPEGWVFPAETKTGHIDSVKSQHRAALRRSGVKPFVLYSLRHTMLTRLGEAGAEAFAIQKIAGHSSVLISQRYVHPSPEAIENAMGRLEAYNASKAVTERVQ
jgi:integrase